MKSDILGKVAEYYSAKLSQYGVTSYGVDWNGADGQVLRFEQLTKIIDWSARFSLNDLGCGYGALLDFLNARAQDFVYNGNDISASMIQAAQARHSGIHQAMFSVASTPPVAADYGIASGILNVKLDCSDGEWLQYVERTLEQLNKTSRRAFAFNCLTSYSDQDKMCDSLYYADPCRIFDYCKRNFSPHVALLHDYGLYEFTVLVRKEL